MIVDKIELSRITNHENEKYLFGTRLSFGKGFELDLTPLETCQLFAKLLFMIPYLIENKK